MSNTLTRLALDSYAVVVVSSPSTRKRLSPRPRPSLAGEQGRRIRERREELGATIQELADAVGVTKQQISRIELGQPVANDTDLVAQIADVLGVPRGWLAFGG